MRNVIRHILRENFDWVSDVPSSSIPKYNPTFDYGDGYKIWLGDMIVEEKFDILKELEELGWDVTMIPEESVAGLILLIFGETAYLSNGDVNPMVKFADKLDKVWFDNWPSEDVTPKYLNENFGWVSDVPEIGIGDNMNLEGDYLDIWPRFENMFYDVGAPSLEGTVQSNDYSGEIVLEVRSEDFMVDVVIDQEFTEDGEGDLITYKMYDPDEYYQTKIEGSYKPGGGDYLQPVIDKLRTFVIPLSKRTV